MLISLLRIKVPEKESSKERKFQGTKVPLITHRVTHRVRLHLAQSSWPSAFTSSITLVQPRDL